MAQYYIHESNFERLEKKMTSLEKKMEATHCSFTYEVTGEEYRTTQDNEGNEYTAKYYVVEVDGTAKYNGWKFVATLDHHEEGNVIRAYDTELAIPEKYKTCGPTCEHCNRIRSRKDTYLVYNEENNEFKQVGRSCLKEFTNGLSAEDIAFFASIYEAFEGWGGYSGINYKRYIEVEIILRYAFECYKHWGFQKSASSFYEEEVPAGYRSTKDRVVDYYYINRAFPQQREALKEEMNEVGFNPDSEYAVENTAAALEWIRNEEKLDNEYIRNLHIICSDQYTDWRSLGILVSLTTAYNRHIGQLAAYEEKKAKQEKEIKSSQYVGEVGDKIELNCSSFACISSWPTQYGMTFLYKFTDDCDNTYVWYASKSVEDEDRVVSIKGTVKDHSEFNGVKQTVLTRCKVTGYAEKEQEEAPNPGTDDVEKAVDEFFAYVNA